VSDLAATLRVALATTRFRAVDWLAETGSTNRDLLEGLEGQERLPAVLVTDHQTAGRGTKGRTWFDPPGGSLLLSVRLFPELPPAQLYLLTMALSLAAADACTELSGVSVGLKWPNDLYVEDRKLAGVLAESSVRAGRVDALVIGIGLNVNWPPDVPAELVHSAVALNQLAGHPIDRARLAGLMISAFDREVATLERAAGDAVGPELLLRRYRAASATLGRRVRLELADGPVTGLAVDITADGHLDVELDATAARPARRQSFAAADVTHLRPAE
jgi:BirA family biotin operon repressor/biotin-[acetyl-CoA-carboxylase] ligase